MDRNKIADSSSYPNQLDPNDPDINEEWVETLSRAERIKNLEKYLSDPNNSDSKERADTEDYLKFLKEQAANHAQCRLVSKVTNTTTPLVRLLIDPTHLRGYGLDVNLNGTHTRIMLDTGAGGISIKRGTAEKAGITKLVETKMWGIGDKGPKNAYVGIAKSIRIGELEFQDCPVEVEESRSIADEDGLIGADVFEKFLVEIDFPAEKLRLSELPKRPGETEQQLTLGDDEENSSDADKSGADEVSSNSKNGSNSVPSGPLDRYISPEMKSYTRVYRFGSHLLVPTGIGDVPEKLFLLDTGALTNFISPSAAREVTKVHGDSDTTVQGVSGSVKNVYSANKAVLRFGSLRQENQDMTAIDMTGLSESHGTEVSGFLGFVMLHFLDIKIDYRDALVDFKYDPERMNHF